MKRLVIALIIFCLTVSLCVTGFFVIEAEGNQMIDLLTSCANEAESCPDSKLMEIADEINKEWSSRSTLFKSVFIHNDFSEIETLLHKLKVFAKQSSSEDFIECCNEAISRLRYTLDNEKPKVQNIF